MAPRSVNDAGIIVLREFEGLRLEAYRCPAGVLTIGYGHTRNVMEGLVIDHAQALRFLDEDVRDAEEAVEANVTVPLNDNQFSALVCFVFNLGETNFRGSTLLRLLNRGWYDQVPAQLMCWNRAGGEVMSGLTRRRAAEARLWDEPVTEEAVA